MIRLFKLNVRTIYNKNELINFYACFKSIKDFDTSFYFEKTKTKYIISYYYGKMK